MRCYDYTLDHGLAIVRLPYVLSESDVNDLQAWFALVLRVATRKPTVERGAAKEVWMCSDGRSHDEVAFETSSVHAMCIYGFRRESHERVRIVKESG